MKKAFLAAEYLCVFFSIVLPPMFAPAAAVSFPFENFQWRTIFFQFLFIILFFLNRKYFFPPFQTKLNFFSGVFLAVVVFALLVAVSLLSNVKSEKITFEVIKIQSAGDIAKIVIIATFGAAFEESLYRDFLLESPKAIFGEKSPKYVWAIFSCVYFALAHRYLGVAAVWNALFSGAILLAAREKSGATILPIAVHSAYNLAAFFAHG